jgi:phospholipase/carboxylesterase
VEDAAAEMTRLGGNVTTRIYQGMGHEVNEDEVRAVNEMLKQVIDGIAGSGSVD